MRASRMILAPREGMPAVTDLHSKSRAARRLGLAALAVVTSLATLGAQQQIGLGANPSDEIRFDPGRGPIDLGLRDNVLIGAIDLHAHMDPDSVGVGNGQRGYDVVEFARLAQ